MTLFAGLRRRVFHPLHARLSGSPRWRYWQELERSQWLSRDRILEIQARRLVELVRFVYDHNDFYRRRFDEAGLNPKQIQSPEDLRRLPILEKPEIRANESSLISRGFDRSRLLEFRTGGSTGKPLRIFLTEDCSERRNACAWRHDRWTGWEIGEPVAALWGNINRQPGLKERLRRSLLAPSIFLDTMDLTVESASRFAEECRTTRPTLLFGHAHSLYQLARIVDSAKLTGITPRGVLSTSMTLLAHERQKIEQTWGVPVHDRYGCEEVSLIASECGATQGMHLNIEHLVVELVDDRGAVVPSGDQGRIVVTDLGNLAMPFLRYSVEDIGSLGADLCPCGRGLPLLNRVDGRLADYLTKLDGARVSGISLIENTLTRIPGIVQMQIEQASIDRFVIRVVPGIDFRDLYRAQLVAYVKLVFGNEVSVEVVLVPRIEPERSGKYRFSVSRIAVENAL